MAQRVDEGEYTWCSTKAVVLEQMKAASLLGFSVAARLVVFMLESTTQHHASHPHQHFGVPDCLHSTGSSTSCNSCLTGECGSAFLFSTWLSIASSHSLQGWGKNTCSIVCALAHVHI